MNATVRRCGYCLGLMDSLPSAPDPSRCPCGRRAITRLPAGGVLTHAEGCAGVGACPCILDLELPRTVLDELRLCKGGVPPADSRAF